MGKDRIGVDGLVDCRGKRPPRREKETSSARQFVGMGEDEASVVAAEGQGV